MRSATARTTGSAVVTGYSVRDFRTRVRPGTVAELIADAGN